MTLSRLHRPLRLAVLLASVTAAVAAFAALGIQFGIRLTNEWQKYAPIRQTAPPTKHDRIVVFAPHCDDEILGCGGLLAVAARNGAVLRVVLVTNGDGYRIGVARAYTTIRVTPEMCTRYAYQRQDETLSALQVLGVSSQSVTFLGYPDRGIAALWDRHWGSDDLYVSHATRTDHSPYANSFRLGAPYCGESLIADIQRIIGTARPTDIYLPHPCDNHSDHYATYCFVTAAVDQLQAEGASYAKRIRMHTYLVHRGDWPVPRTDNPREPLAPPYALARSSTVWSSLDLPDDVAKLKQQAIRQYRTQTAVGPGFLKSFARANEVFGNLPTPRVMRVTNGAIAVDGNPEDWHGVPPVVVDPVGDYVVAEMSRGGDVRSIYACIDDEHVYIRLDCVRRISKRITYSVGLRGVGKTDGDDHYAVSISPPSRCDRESVRWAAGTNLIEMAVPLAQFKPDDSLFVRVNTRLIKLKVDDTGWHNLEIGDHVVEPADARK